MFVKKSTHQGALNAIAKLKEENASQVKEFDKNLSGLKTDFNEKLATLTADFNKKLAAQESVNKDLLADTDALLEDLALSAAGFEFKDRNRRVTEILGFVPIDKIELTIKPEPRKAQPAKPGEEFKSERVASLSKTDSSKGIKHLEDFLKKHPGMINGSGAVTVVKNGKSEMITLSNRADIQKVIKDAKAGKVQIVV